MARSSAASTANSTRSLSVAPVETPHADLLSVAAARPEAVGFPALPELPIPAGATLIDVSDSGLQALFSSPDPNIVPGQQTVPFLPGAVGNLFWMDLSAGTAAPVIRLVTHIAGSTTVSAGSTGIGTGIVDPFIPGTTDLSGDGQTVVFDSPINAHTFDATVPPASRGRSTRRCSGASPCPTPPGRLPDAADRADAGHARAVRLPEPLGQSRRPDHRGHLLGGHAHGGARRQQHHAPTLWGDRDRGPREPVHTLHAVHDPDPAAGAHRHLRRPARLADGAPGQHARRRGQHQPQRHLRRHVGRRLDVPLRHRRHQLLFPPFAPAPLPPNFILGGFENLWSRQVDEATTRLVSVGWADTASGNRPTRAAAVLPGARDLLPNVSETGRFVVFATASNTIVPGINDRTFKGGVFVRDMQTGAATIVSTTATGNVPSAGTFLEYALAAEENAAGTFRVFLGGTGGGDVDGDGFADVIVASGPGTRPRAEVYSGRLLTQGAAASRIAAFALSATPTAGQTGDGAFVAAADMTGDGRSEIVASFDGRPTADQPAGPGMRVVAGRYARAAAARHRAVPSILPGR